MYFAHNHSLPRIDRCWRSSSVQKTFDGKRWRRILSVLSRYFLPSVVIVVVKLRGRSIDKQEHFLAVYQSNDKRIKMDMEEISCCYRLLFVTSTRRKKTRDRKTERENEKKKKKSISNTNKYHQLSQVKDGFSIVFRELSFTVKEHSQSIWLLQQINKQNMPGRYIFNHRRCTNYLEGEII